MIGGGVSVAVVLVMTCFLASQADAQIYEIVFTRFSSNGVQLTCRLNGGGTLDGSAFFFQNGTFESSVMDAATDSYTFLVDRLENEGQYTCSNDINIVSGSDFVNVIAQPSTDHQVALDGSITIRAKSGTTAILPPYIGPGIWFSRYYIDWKNRTGTNEISVGAIRGLRNTVINQGIERFSVEPNTFSLKIESVTRHTDAGNYFGELGVMEAEGASEMNYMQTISMGIRLEVYEEPRIMQELVSVTMKYEENAVAQFTCTAKGFPAPTISWKHNGNPVSTSSTIAKYSVKEMAPNQDSEDTVTRILMIHNIHPVDSGSVRCVATVEPGGDIPPVKDSKIVANFSVLNIFDVDVYRTVENKLIFIVNIGDDVMIPIGLRIQLDFEDGQEPLTTSEVYMNTNSLTFVYDDPPEALFTSIVSVTVVESRGSRSSLPMSKDLSMEIKNEFSLYQRLITIAIPVGSGLVTVCLLLFCISILCCIKCWINDREDIRKHNYLETGSYKFYKNLKKVQDNPKSTCDQKCEKVGDLLDYFQHIEEQYETVHNGTQIVSSSGPPPCQEYNCITSAQSSIHMENAEEPSALTLSVVFDNNNKRVTCVPPSDLSPIKTKGKSCARERRKIKPYKKCTREEAIQKGKELFRSLNE